MPTNLLHNGDFSRGLYQWDGTGTIDRATGYPRPGCLRLAAGQSMRQGRGISQEALHTLHYFYQVASGATLTVGYGDVTQEHTGEPFDTWREGSLVFALEPGQDTNAAVLFSAAGGVCLVDTVSFLPAALPVSRARIATEVAGRIVDLATDAGLDAAPDADGPEGDYAAAIDEALRSVGAVNRWGDPDVTQVQANQINDVIEAARTAMLQRLQGHYSLKTDVSLGPRRESFSQQAKAIGDLLTGPGAERRVSMGRLRHGAWRKG